MKLQKIQKWLCFIPFYSTFVIAIISMFHFKKNNARFKIWLGFAGTLVAAVFLTSFINNFIMSGEHQALNFIASALVLTLANFLLINLQEKCTAEGAGESVGTRKLVIILVACVHGIIILSAIVSAILLIPKIERPTYEDINGSDTHLAILTEEGIVAGTYSGSMKFVSHGFDGNQTLVEHYRYEEYDYDKSTFRCRVMNGDPIMQATLTDADNMKLEISSVLTAGNAEIFIIIDGECRHRLPADQNHTIDLQDISGKLILVKVAGESAEIDFSVTRSFS